MRQKTRAKKCLNQRRCTANDTCVSPLSPDKQQGSTYRCDGLRVSEKHPQLDDGEAAHPRDSEESNPLDTQGGTQAQTRRDQPEPPGRAERMRRTQFLLVGETGERQRGESREEDQGGVQKDQTGLGDETIF